MRKPLKPIIILLFAAAAVLPLAAAAHADSMEALVDQFNQDFEALKPEPHSSVNSDYVFRQTALGSLYMTRALGMLYEQNREFLDKYEEVSAKYDQIIEQNQEIIRLLGIIAAEKGGKP